MHIAGFLDRLDGDHPQWDATATPLTRVDATHWTITFTGLEGTQLEYKYALADFLYVEKDGACGEIANRQLTLSYGATGTADRQRHRPELAQRGALRELTLGSRGRRAAGPGFPRPGPRPVLASSLAIDRGEGLARSSRFVALRPAGTLRPNVGSGRLGRASGAAPGPADALVSSSQSWTRSVAAHPPEMRTPAS